jgi:hypothetical protein
MLLSQNDLLMIAGDYKPLCITYTCEYFQWEEKAVSHPW